MFILMIDKNFRNISSNVREFFIRQKNLKKFNYFCRCFTKNPGDAHGRMSPARNKVHSYNRGGV